MSNKLDKSTIPTNEEIIEDLTKEFKSTKIEGEEESPSQQVPKDFEDSDNDEDDPDKPTAEDRLKEKNEFDDLIDEELLKETELNLSEEEKEQRHSDVIALKKRGNEEFLNSNYIKSVATYTEALRLCPLKYTEDRAILFGNRAASKAYAGRKESALEDCSKALELKENYFKVYLRRAKLYEECDKLDESLADYKKVLEMDPANKEALGASQRLPPLIDERNEKLKTEMFGKLKDLGNVILRPFGLSTSNFKMVQDPATGGYSINFQQNNS